MGARFPRTYALLVLSCLVGLGVDSRSAFGQATTAREATKAAQEQVLKRQSEVAAVANEKAAAASKAAAKAAAAATSATDAAENAGALAKADDAQLSALQDAGAASVKAAADASQAASATFKAAMEAAETVKIETARAAAGAAAGKAYTAAEKAATASGAAAKANEKLAGAKSVAEAREALTSVAKETGLAAVATAEAATAAAEAALEAARPSLPVIAGRDESVLEALRARITGGAIFFNGAAAIIRSEDGSTAIVQSNQFSQAATYLAFETQPRLWSGDVGFCGKDKVCRAARQALFNERGYRRLYVEPFANVRLTTIPVAGTANTLASIEAPSQTFLQSQKAVQLQMGAQAGVNFGKVTINETDFHWGFGPVVRYMFQNVTDSQRALRPWDLDNDLFKLSSFGIRLTMYEHEQHVGESKWHGWAPAAYIDVSRGRFENFETAKGNTEAAITCLQNVPACLAREGGVPPEEEFDTTNSQRWYIEGRVFLQYLYLGFDLNSGRGPDDLRFIGGLTVKLDQFFTRRR